MTGGVLSFGQMGASVCPSAFALLLRITGGYSAGWMIWTVPAIWVGLNLRRSGPTAGREQHSHRPR